jgi:hypothetical protein
MRRCSTSGASRSGCAGVERRSSGWRRAPRPVSRRARCSPPTARASTTPTAMATAPGWRRAGLRTHRFLLGGGTRRGQRTDARAPGRSSG